MNESKKIPRSRRAKKKTTTKKQTNKQTNKRQKTNDEQIQKTADEL